LHRSGDRCPAGIFFCNPRRNLKGILPTPLLTWTEKLSVGVGVPDEGHKRLVAMVNELYDAMQAGHGEETLGWMLNDLAQYTKVHFALEEKFFAETGYPASALHQQEHDALTKQVMDVEYKYMSGASSARCRSRCCAS
jgi:hemerythrin